MKKDIIFEKADEAWDYVWNKLYSPETNVIYDVPYKSYSFPTPEEIAAGVPNGCGWNTCMEDGMISAGNMLSAVVNRYSVTGDEALHEYSAKLLEGIRRCAKVSGERGFLARSVHPTSPESFYPDSSRDQYTMVVFGMCNYYRSPLCTEQEKEVIRDIMEDFSYRAIKNVTEENDWHYLRADGKPGIVDKMWKTNAHEYLRLPMIYYFTYYTTGNELYLQKYLELIDEAIEASFTDVTYSSYAILHQMQTSARCLWELDPDPVRHEKLAQILRLGAQKGVGMTEKTGAGYLSGELSINHPAPDWRACTMKYFCRRLIGEKGYFVPIFPEEHQNGCIVSVMNTFCPISVQLLCPGFEVSEKDVECMKEVLKTFSFENVQSRGVPYIIETYWLLAAAEAENKRG